MKKLFWYLLDSIFLIVFNLYFFLLNGNEQPESVWVSYGAIHLAYFVLLITPYFVRKGSRSADYEQPLFGITKTYFIAALIVGVGFMLYPVTTTAAILTHVTIIAFFAILLLFNLIANEHTADAVERHEQELIYVKEASSALGSCMKQIADNKIRKKVERAYDTIHGSQAKSSAEVSPIEHEIFDEIRRLQSAIGRNDNEDIALIANNIYNLAAERNRLLKLTN